MQNILLIGLGRFGRSCAFKLHELQQQVMAVDCEEERVNKVLPFITSAIIGDSTDSSFLKSLGIGNFDSCIVAIGDNFISSLETTSLLKELGAKRVISRASSLTQEKFLLRNGADEVVFPEKEMAHWTAMRCSSGIIRNYIAVYDDYSIYEVPAPTGWVGKSIAQLDIRQKYDITILGMHKSNETKPRLNISGTTVIDADEILMVLADDRDMRKCFNL